MYDGDTNVGAGQGRFDVQPQKAMEKAADQPVILISSRDRR